MANCDRLYLYRDWDRWVKDLGFERRMQRQPGRSDSVLAE